MNEINKEQVVSVLERTHASVTSGKATCILCGDKAFTSACWIVPAELSSPLSMPWNYRHVVGYGLCKACSTFLDEGDQENIEDILISYLAEHAQYTPRHKLPAIFLN